MCTLLVLLLVLHCFALCNARDPLRITRLFAWARLKGAYIHSCLEYRDAGMYTTCTIPPNTLLTCVPNELILDPEVPKNETRGTVFARVLPSADESHPLLFRSVSSMSQTDVSNLTDQILREIDRRRSNQ